MLILDPRCDSSCSQYRPDLLVSESPSLARARGNNENPGSDSVLILTEETEAVAELNLVDRVYRSLRAGIVDGTYSPNTPLRLKAVAKTNGVSLIPVREALRLLERERLVVATPNKGARVAPISLECLSDLYRVRKIVEAEALSLAAPRLSASNLSELRSIVMGMADLFANTDKAGYLKLHRQFHFGIYQKSDSDWLMHIIETLWGHADRYIHLAVSYERSAEEVLLEHLRILDKIGCGDFEGSCSALRDDLDHTIQRVQAVISMK